jgi:hypothetical protein
VARAAVEASGAAREVKSGSDLAVGEKVGGEVAVLAAASTYKHTQKRKGRWAR